MGALIMPCMQSLDRALLRYFLPKLLSRACGETVHRSGSEAMKANCFTTTISKGLDPFMVLLSIAGKTVSGLEFDGTRYATPRTLQLDEIDPTSIAVAHYYGLDEIRYRGISAVAWGRLTRWPYVWFHLNRLANAVAQHVFNRRTLEVRRRLDILRDVVDAVESDANAVDAMDLMSRRYGDRWADHPGWKAHHRLLKLHLELLTESGELAAVQSRYRPTGLALKTLEESEEQDRKHSANLRMQLFLTVLTFVSAVMAAAQAGLLKLPTLLDLTSKSAQAGNASAEPPIRMKVIAVPSTSLPASVTVLAPSTAASEGASAPAPSGGPSSFVSGSTR